MLHKFLDPKNDIAFKKIFGTEKNKDILIHFLNDMLIFKEGGKIKDLTFLKTNQDPEISVLTRQALWIFIVKTIKATTTS